jgi:glycosyltransferase involved in cell wall biosynthesis
MIIGIDGSRAFVEGRTGTENYSYQLIKNLSFIDLENSYLIYLRPGQNPGKDWPENFKFKTLSYPRLWTQVGLALQTFLDPLEVLFVPAHTLPLIRKPGLKTVITVHDLGSEYLPGLHQLKQVLYLKLMTHYQIKTATKVISVSEATKEDLINRIGIKAGKIEVVYEGVDKTVFKKMPKDVVNDIVKKYDLERGKYFLFVGTIQPRKNLRSLIFAFKKFLSQTPDIKERPVSGIKHQTSSRKSHNTKYLIPDTGYKLVLVGQKGWKSEDIYKLPEELGIEDSVRFLGRVPDQELAGLYNGACALTYPSLFEGFGLPILEAFACGCPVITSNTSSMPEVAGDGAILVNPEKQEEIFKALKQIYANDILRYSMTKKGILRLGRFSWKIAAKQTIDILKETVTK